MNRRVVVWGAALAALISCPAWPTQAAEVHRSAAQAVDTGPVRGGRSSTVIGPPLQLHPDLGDGARRRVRTSGDQQPAAYQVAAHEQAGRREAARRQAARRQAAGETPRTVARDFDPGEERGHLGIIAPVQRTPAGFDFGVSGASCGWSSRLIDTYSGQKLFIEIDDKRFEFLAVMLTDKTAYRFNAVKVRSACVGRIARTPSGFSIELKEANATGADGTVINVDGRGLITYDPHNSRFFLMPYLQGSRDPRPFPAIVADALAKYKCASRPYCATLQNYFVERKFLDRLRALRSVTLPPDEEALDTVEFLALYANQEGPGRVVHELRILGKIGEASPYELQDPLTADGGPTFGAECIDIAKSRGGARLIGDIVRGAYAGDSSRNAVRLIRIMDRHAYEKPIRTYSVADLHDLYGDWLLVNAALRAVPGRQAYGAFYRSQIDRQVTEFRELARAYAWIDHNPWVGFYFIDFANRPDAMPPSLPALARAARRATDPNDLAARIGRLELKAPGGRRHPADVTRRIENIRKIVAGHLG